SAETISWQFAARTGPADGRRDRAERFDRRGCGAQLLPTVAKGLSAERAGRGGARGRSLAGAGVGGQGITDQGTGNNEGQVSESASQRVSGSARDTGYDFAAYASNERFRSRG